MDMLEILYPNESDIPTHIAQHLDKLKSSHPSGISEDQLATPMMRQFSAAKEQMPDALIFFRMGDFFEFFGIDAVIAAEVCQLTLTSRDKSSENPIPMAGVPAVSYLNAVKKCLQAGFKVAICDQVEDPRQAKAIVKREIIRVATPACPGDLGEETEPGAGCYLACAIEKKGLWTLSVVDLSTGELRLTFDLNRDLLMQEIATYQPKEILVDGINLRHYEKWMRVNISAKTRISAFESWILKDEKESEEFLTAFFSKDKLRSSGLKKIPNGVLTLAGLLTYLKQTQKESLNNIQEFEVYTLDNVLKIDQATKKNLDFFYTVHGEKRGSLFGFLNRCRTSVGARSLARLLNYPYRDKNKIKNSQELILDCVNLNYETKTNLHQFLGQCIDLDRFMARVSQKSIDPRAFVALNYTLETLPKVAVLVSQVSPRWKQFADSLKNQSQLKKLSDTLKEVFVDEPAQLGKMQRVFKPGYSAAIDELYDLKENAHEIMQNIEKKEREKTGINNLKIGFTRVFGYYIDVSKGKTHLVPSYFIRKQTLTNGERYITDELKQIEEKLLNAEQKVLDLERELFENVRSSVLPYFADLREASQWIAECDVVLNFAGLAQENNWCKPEISDERKTWLWQSVHPVMKSLASATFEFVPNDIVLGGGAANMLLVTGPNMAGKSTLMRQAALAQILFQMGSWVPAQRAEMGVCDQILSRIGSGDDATRHQSTFMVEMSEVAFMLRYATAESMLLLDEVGRGTSTYDGVSLAAAILETLHDDVRGRVFFSTHYHELVEIARSRKDIKPMKMEVAEAVSAEGASTNLLFTHRFLPGAAEKSYGVQVARLAGLPEKLVQRAESILNSLGTMSSVPTPKTKRFVKKQDSKDVINLFEF